MNQQSSRPYPSSQLKKSQIGVLTLIPTPIHENLPLESKAHEMMSIMSESSEVRKHSILAVETPKEFRKSWKSWGFEITNMPTVVSYNKHSWKEESELLLAQLMVGKNIFLVSDCGLPAFCDPGRHLIDLCHKRRIKVTSTPFPHSISLALALSGFDLSEFTFWGFLPRNKSERIKKLQKTLTTNRLGVYMDTPYRLVPFLESVSVLERQGKIRIRDYFLALELNGEKERLLRGKMQTIFKYVQEMKEQKLEFILVANTWE